MPENRDTVREKWVLTGIFCAALLAHAWLATRNWTAGFMAGHEFRQTQTALITYYIDKDNDFSLLYEQPILGKPWVGLLLEVPFYQWCVVGVSRATGLGHVVAARWVSLTCFYLALPAFYLLLGRLGLTRPRRLLALALVLCCPVYIFYSRAFLIEAMELMCSAWFLVAYLVMMERRRWPWFVLASAVGTVAALLKSATLAVWLLPAAACSAWRLAQDLRRRPADWRAVADTVFWGLAGVAVPLGALRLWIGLTDPIKAAHASAWIFTAGNLSMGNWGLNDLSARFSPKLWGTLFERWSEALMPPWLIGAALLAALAAFPAERRRIAGVAATFFLAQVLFPFAYAYQEYYFYACGVFLLGGLAFALQGVLDSRLPRWACWLLVAVLPAAELHTYARVYLTQQRIKSDGGFSFTEALREFTPPESVIVVGGADWSSIVPYYAQRRALLIRNGLTHDRAYLDRAFADLDDEDVCALVLLWNERANTALRDRAVKAFDLDPRPTFSHEIADVYCSRRYLERMRAGLKLRGNYGDLKVPPAAAGEPAFNPGRVRLTEGLARTALAGVSPRPIMGEFKYGMGGFVYLGAEVMNAHPDSDLWLRAPGRTTRIEWDFGLVDAAWNQPDTRSDGVEFTVTGVLPGAEDRPLYHRYLDPVQVPADRGLQHVVIPFTPRPGELLRFSTRPGPTYSFDWAYWRKIEVK